jgi:hypothetical protein
MKWFIGLLGLGMLLLTSGCYVHPAYPGAGVSVGVYGEYPTYYYGNSGYYYHSRPYGYHRWHHPYDRDHYYYRSHTW